MVILLPRKKKPDKGEETKKTEVAVTTKKAPAPKKTKEKPTPLAPAALQWPWGAFDDAFSRFRSDVEDLI